MMKCVNCGAMIPESADKCGVCLCPNMGKRGIELLLKCFTNTQIDLRTGIVCRYCGKMIRSEFKFCIFCGESQKRDFSLNTHNDLYLKQLYYDNADEYHAPIILDLKEKYTVGFYRYMLGEPAKVVFSEKRCLIQEYTDMKGELRYVFKETRLEDRSMNYMVVQQGSGEDIVLNFFPMTFDVKKISAKASSAFGVIVDNRGTIFNIKPCTAKKTSKSEFEVISTGAVIVTDYNASSNVFQSLNAEMKKKLIAAYYKDNA